MAKAYAFVANGTEEAELLNVVDILRRAGVETVIASADDELVVCSHGTKLKADRLVCDCDFSDADLLFVPGGMPGSTRLGTCPEVVSALDVQVRSGRHIAAVCAAPAVVFGANGMLVGKKGVCYPGFEDKMDGCYVKAGARVVTDGNVTTARGLGCAIDLGLELVRILCGQAAADRVKAAIQY